MLKRLKTIFLLVVLFLSIGYVAAAEDTTHYNPKVQSLGNKTYMDLNNREAGYILEGLRNGTSIDVIIEEIKAQREQLNKQRELNRQKKWYIRFYDYFKNDYENNDRYVPYHITITSNT